jgi:hypothetical protein
LILSLADERSKKHQKVLDRAREGLESDYSATLSKLANKKERKAEWIAQYVHTQHTMLYSKMIKFITYTALLRRRYIEVKTVRIWNNFISRKAAKITELFRQWLKRSVEFRRKEIQKVVAKSAWRILIRMRILRKQKGVTKIVQFLTACVGHQAVSAKSLV